MRLPENLSTVFPRLGKVLRGALCRLITTADQVRSSTGFTAPIRARHWPSMLVGIRSLFGVFQDLARLRVDTDFVDDVATFYVEGVAEAAATLLLFQFLIGDRSRMSLQGD